MPEFEPPALKTACVVMAKQPLVGSTKTRMCPPLTLAEAAGLYEALLKDTLSLVQKLTGIQMAVAVTPPDGLAYFENLTPPGTPLLPIEGRDIGHCLSQAFERLFGAGYNRGFERVLAINSDGPSLPAAYIQQAVQALGGSDLVFGPSDDGGYYLVGMKEPHPELFEDIDWSTDRVLAQSLARAEVLGLTVYQTPAWYDVDSAPDLARLAAEMAESHPTGLTFTRQFLSHLDLRHGVGNDFVSPGGSPSESTFTTGDKV